MFKQANNFKTCYVGFVVLIRKLLCAGHDISKPLKNSFIHTGHGDVLSGNTWGDPRKIDE